MRPEEICARRFVSTHPEDAARLIEQHEAAESARFIEQLAAADAARVLERMNQAVAAHCVDAMQPEQGAAAIALLAPAIAAQLLRRLPAQQRDALLETLREDDAGKRLRRLLTHPEGTVGAIADPGVLALAEDVSVGEALRQLRRFHGAAHHHVYVVDRAQRLMGVVHLRDLVGSRHRAALRSIMQPTRAYLSARSRLTTAAAHPAWRELDTLPVADDAGVLLGMVRHRQLRDVAQPEAAGTLTGALVSLAELYWLGLATFLPVTTTHEGSHAQIAEPTERGYRDA
jgi:magnesium transporter